jgi:hypothetical protein
MAACSTCQQQTLMTMMLSLPGAEWSVMGLQTWSTQPSVVHLASWEVAGRN